VDPLIRLTALPLLFGGHERFDAMENDRTKELEELNEEAVMVADHYRSGYYPRAEALVDLARRRPGFTNEEYESAFAHGLQHTR